MQRLKLKLSNRKGFTLILSALMLVIFIGVAAMAVDVSHQRLNRADVHSAADAAALAGIEKYASTGDAGLASAEASLYAGKFKADASTLIVASFTMGGWDSTLSYPAAFKALGAAGTVPADDVVIQHAANYIFAPALFGHITQHTASATSIAVGIDNKSVTRSSCVSPGLMSFGALQAQLGTSDNPLTDADIQALATNHTPFHFHIPQGNKVSGPVDTEFVQINLPPSITAAGAVQILGRRAHPTIDPRSRAMPRTEMLTSVSGIGFSRSRAKCPTRRKPESWRLGHRWRFCWPAPSRRRRPVVLRGMGMRFRGASR